MKYDILDRVLILFIVLCGLVLVFLCNKHYTDTEIEKLKPKQPVFYYIGYTTNCATTNMVNNFSIKYSIHE